MQTVVACMTTKVLTYIDQSSLIIGLLSAYWAIIW